MANVYVYEYFAEENHEGFLYVNLTNKCTNRCTFCIRNNANGVGGDADLWLTKEPAFEDVVDALGQFDVNQYKEVVFCGYGEPTMRLDVLLEVAAYVKKHFKCSVRVNTNGHANAIHKEDVTSRFAGLIDTLSISMNAPDAKAYNEICQCCFGEAGFDYMLEFAKCACAYVPNVLLSIVDIMPKEDIERCKALAAQTGCKLRIRHYVEN